MNKSHAKEKADNFVGTFGELVAMIQRDARADNEPSNVNPRNISHGQVKLILLACLCDHPADQRVSIWTPAGRRSKFALIVQNVFRECA